MRIVRDLVGVAFLAGSITLLPAIAWAQEGEGSELELQNKLANPVASLTLVPFNFNFDTRIGPYRKGDRMTMNFQPVLPYALDKGWSLVVRTIMPVISQDDILPGAGSQFGLGDTLQSFFFVTPPAGGFLWAAGPVVLYPTGTDPLLTGGKWGAGITFLGLYQKGPWTALLLTNHVWSIAGPSGRPNISNTFLQPVITYAASGGWTFSASSQSTYDWVARKWSVPVYLSVSKLLRIGTQTMSIAAGPKYWATSPEGGPHGWAAFTTVTFILP